MRFSYIDSQGKEIEVDSVESLALRIELGAIQPDTRMYDAVADRWAPAEEHPVFRSLSRGEEVSEDDVVHIGEEEGAPPSPASGPDEGKDEPEAGPEVVESEPGQRESEPGEAGAPPDEPDSEPDEPDAVPGTGSEEFRVEAEPGPAGPGAETPEPDAGVPGEDAEESGAGEPEPVVGEGGTGGASPDSGADDVLGLDFEVSLSGEEEAAPEAEEPDAPAEGPEVAPDEHGVTPGGAGAKPPSDEAGDPSASGARAGGDGETAEAEEPSPADAAPLSADDEVPPWAVEGEALWDDEPGSDDAAAGEAQLEDRPAASPSPGQEDAAPPVEPDEAMPAWARPDEDETEGEEEEEVEVESAPASPQPEVRKREPAPRPAHWEERRRARERRHRLVRIAGVALILAVVGGAGVYAVRAGPFGGASGEESGEARRPLISAELRPVMAEVSESAYDDVLARLRQQVGERDLAARPPIQWLDGIYLSTAGDFPAVSAYWQDIRDAVGDLRSREARLFREGLEEHLGARTGGETSDGGLTDEEASRVREAALANYRATEEARSAVYDRILSVAEGSLELHRLLVERESDIDYEPFSDPGVSRDPVLEAVPSDSVLRVRMNQRLDRVLGAVVDAGIPRPITTAGLVDHLLQGLREAGVVAPRPLRVDEDEDGEG